MAKASACATATISIPRFETYREQIDGKYWFPTYTHADDTLNFKDMSQRIKLVIRYQDYKQYEGKSSIKFGDVVDDKTSTRPLHLRPRRNSRSSPIGVPYSPAKALSITGGAFTELSGNFHRDFPSSACV